MRISVIGTGYVGLVTAVCLAEKGHDVTVVDIDAAKVERVNKGISPFFEPGLDELLQRHVGQKLRATTDLRTAVVESEVTFIAVGTPFDGKTIDLTFVKKASEDIGWALREKIKYHVVVVKSTVVPGSTDDVVSPTLEASSGKKASKDFGVGMNPEFLTEGEAISDFMQPDRIVIGGNDPETLETLKRLYSVFPGVPIVTTNCKTAEMIKYASNTLLATLISFSNELANLGAALGGIDAAEVMEGLHLSRYLLPLAPDGTPVRPSIVSFLMPGCGFGGSCLPKDVKALMAHGQKMGESMRLLEAVLDINAGQHGRMFALLKKHFPSLTGLPVTVLGLAFRPDTDDMRESPSIPIIKMLIAERAKVTVFDPAAMHEGQKHFGDAVTYASSLENSLENSAAVLLVTRWEAFAVLPELLAKMPVPPLLVDGRRFISRMKVARYEGIGL